MDKRNFLGEQTYRIDDKDILVNVYSKNGRSISCRINFGQVEMYVPKYYLKRDFDKLLNKAIKKYLDANITTPYYKEGSYIFLLGKRRILTQDPFFKDNELCFYYSKNASDPLSKYKKEFIAYLQERVIEIGKRMNLNLTSWKIRTGLFLSYYGICFPTKKQLKFDYRLFAYKEEIIDSIIIHELCHIFEHNHSNKFYNLVYTYCPDYDKLQKYISYGFFGGANGYQSNK